MAARHLSQTLIRFCPSATTPTERSLLFAKSKHVCSSRFLTLRRQSSRSDNNFPNHLIESPAADNESVTVKWIEDAIHRSIVMRSAPDWLPFRPGSSYWVPPRRESYGIAELVKTFANNLTQEEATSLLTPCGWPSSAFFTAPSDTSPYQAEEETTSTNVSQPEDEE